jgi:hypothetical protein
MSNLSIWRKELDGYTDREHAVALSKLMRDIDEHDPLAPPPRESAEDRDERLYEEHVDRCLVEGEDWR